MAAVPLPDNPNLEQLRRQAKDVRDCARAGWAGALALVAEHHPDGAHAVSLAGAQLVVARHYGFASWARLKHHVELLQAYRRDPDEVHEATDPADRFLLHACLRYGDDDIPDRRRQAARLLGEHPEITRRSIHAAAAAADDTAVEAHLATDPAAANRDGGPYAWPPLLYLAYARPDPTVPEARVLRTARLLLAHGADPNAGFLWHGLPTPFTVLTGVLGNGPADSGADGSADDQPAQPEHPHAFALATLLLDAGADPNDGQALYNRQFHADDRHLALLLAHGLGRGDGGPWRARFGHTVDDPAAMVRQQLWWAIVHDLRDRVRLLIDHGVDLRIPFTAPGGRPTWARTSHGRTPAEAAALAGCPEVVDLLVAAGADRPSGEGVDGLIAAALAGDRAGVERLREHAAAARTDRPGLLVWAAARGLHDGVALLLDLGWDVNARARGDIPMEQAWETALHEAAARDDVALARLLLEHGADPDARDARFDATPLGWARHFDHPAIAALLQPLTSEG